MNLTVALSILSPINPSVGTDPPHSAGGLRGSAGFCAFTVSAARTVSPELDQTTVQTLIIPVLTRARVGSQDPVIKFHFPPLIYDLFSLGFVQFGAVSEERDPSW